MDDAVVVVREWRDALIGMEAHMQLLAVIFALTSEGTTDEAVQAWQRAYPDPFERITAALALAVHALAVDAPAVHAPRGRRARAEQEMVALSHRLLRHYRGLLPSARIVPPIVPPMMVPRMPPPPMPTMPPQRLAPGRHPPPQSPPGRRAAATLSAARSTVDDAADRLRKRDLLTLTTLVFHHAFWTLMLAAVKLVQRVAAVRRTEGTWKHEEQVFYKMLVATQGFLRAARDQPNHLRAVDAFYEWGVRRAAERARWAHFLPKTVPRCFSGLTDDQVACVAHAIAAFASNDASEGFRSLLDAVRTLSPDALGEAQGDLGADMSVRVQDWKAELRAFFGSVVGERLLVARGA